MCYLPDPLGSGAVPQRVNPRKFPFSQENRCIRADRSRRQARGRNGMHSVERTVLIQVCYIMSQTHRSDG